MRVIGVDLGGTQLRLRLCQRGKSILEEPEILAERRELVEERIPAGVVSQLTFLIREMLQETGLAESDLVVSCAVAGMLDGGGQVVKNAPNLEWRDVPFAAMLRDALPQVRHVVLWNDLNAATWGEFVAGAGIGVKNVVAVFAGSGVGGGLVLNSRLHDGAWGTAGEIGHLKVVPHGRLCGCGGLGCVEAYAGGHAMANIARERFEHSPFLQHCVASEGIDKLSPVEIAAGAREGDAVCSQILQQAGNSLGLAISHLVTLVNPAKVILGGGVLLHWSELRKLVEEHVFDSISTPASIGLQLVSSTLGDDAGMVGAVDLALR